MNIDAAAWLARDLMRTHLPEGWRFEWGRQRFKDDGHMVKLGGAVAMCYPDGRVIFLDYTFARIEEEDFVRQILLHEIAHALLYEESRATSDPYLMTDNYAHGERFRAKCQALKTTQQYPYVNRPAFANRQWSYLPYESKLVPERKQSTAIPNALWRFERKAGFSQVIPTLNIDKQLT